MHFTPREMLKLTLMVCYGEIHRMAIIERYDIQIEVSWKWGWNGWLNYGVKEHLGP